MAEVDILMATYNGAQYLREQIDSILAQKTVHNYKLIISDDGSSDDTISIINSYVNSQPNIILIVDREVNRGALGRFSFLIDHSSSPYIMFCDQDDIWLPNKIDLMMEKIKVLEMRFGVTFPLLCYSDLIVVDKKLDPINKSFWDYQGLDPKKSSFTRSIVQNMATGCTIIINRSLINKSVPIPPSAVMHDWWFYLVASAFGSTSAVEEPTILYRQHESNTLGAHNRRSRSIFNKAIHFFDRSGIIKIYEESQKQATAFAQKYAETPEAAIALSYIRLRNNNFFTRKFIMLKYSFYRSNFLQNLAWIIRL